MVLLENVVPVMINVALVAKMPEPDNDKSFKTSETIHKIVDLKVIFTVALIVRIITSSAVVEV